MSIRKPTRADARSTSPPEDTHVSCPECGEQFTASVRRSWNEREALRALVEAGFRH